MSCDEFTMTSRVSRESKVFFNATIQKPCHFSLSLGILPPARDQTVLAQRITGPCDLQDYFNSIIYPTS